MADADEKREGAGSLTGLQAALADVAERRRKNPCWGGPRFDGSYSGPDPDSLAKMTEADYAAWQARREEERRWLRGDDPRPVEPHQVVRQEEPQPPSRPHPQPVVRACLPFGQRVRELRRALGWTQREIAWRLGISMRTVIRYEQGRSGPLQSAPLLALRRLESAHAQELDAYDASYQRARA